MNDVSPLPEYLINRYIDWKSTGYESRKDEIIRLADEGQHPKAMVISCCDSRVHVTSIFGAETGEFFIHRNIANQVPPFVQDDAHHGTSAAIEFAVTVLKVEHLIVVGHSQCGGVQHCHDICSGDITPSPDSFVSKWVDIIEPAYARIKDIKDDQKRITALEHMGVVVALENLQGFPFIREAIASGQLTTHGIWHNIRDGGLMALNPESGEFETVS